MVVRDLVSHLSLATGAGSGNYGMESIEALPAFIAALNVVLRAYHYPDHTLFTAYPAALSDATHRASVLDFLCSELQAARMCCYLQNKRKTAQSPAASTASSSASAGSAGAAASTATAAGAAPMPIDSQHKSDSSSKMDVSGDDNKVLLTAFLPFTHTRTHTHDSLPFAHATFGRR